MRPRLVFLLACTALGAGACSSEERRDSAPPPQGVEARLRIEFSRTGSDLSWFLRLRCPGERSGARALCKRLDADAGGLVPDLGDVACPLPVGVPLVFVSGLVGKREIEQRYSPCNGGENVVERWQELAAASGEQGDESFAALRARPLRPPRLHPEAFCPDPDRGAIVLPAAIPAEAGLGLGPVHPVSRGIPRFLDFFPPDRSSPLAKSSWRANETMWVSEPSYQGPVLVRGRSVNGRARMGFGPGKRPTWELRLPAGAWKRGRPPVRIWEREIYPPPGWRVTATFTRILERSRSGACYFFQIDGKGFSETILVGTLIQP